MQTDKILAAVCHKVSCPYIWIVVYTLKPQWKFLCLSQNALHLRIMSLHAHLLTCFLLPFLLNSIISSRRLESRVHDLYLQHKQQAYLKMTMTVCISLAWWCCSSVLCHLVTKLSIVKKNQGTNRSLICTAFSQIEAAVDPRPKDFSVCIVSLSEWHLTSSESTTQHWWAEHSVRSLLYSRKAEDCKTVTVQSYHQQDVHCAAHT